MVQMLEERVDIGLLRPPGHGGGRDEAERHQRGGNQETKERTHRLLANLWHRGHLLQDDGPGEQTAESNACRDTVRFADGARLSSRRIPHRKANLRTGR
jgi:hypothetical protein